MCSLHNFPQAGAANLNDSGNSKDSRPAVQHCRVEPPSMPCCIGLHGRARLKWKAQQGQADAACLPYLSQSKSFA